MTRVNLIPAQELCDQHLLGEYHEITRIPQGVITGRLKAVYSDRPLVYARGKGHMKFFTNKCRFIHQRFQELVIESKVRGFNVTGQFPDVERLERLGVYNDWTPSADDIEASRRWLLIKLPEDARWAGKGISWPLTLVDNEDLAGRIPGQRGYRGPAR